MNNTFWYVVKVFAGKERKLCEQFNEMIEHGKMPNVLRFICPLEKEYVTVRNKKVIRDKVIYNGYIYFETENKLTVDELTHIGFFENVLSMYGDRKPVLMPNSDVRRIIKDDVLDQHIEHKLIRFVKGSTVEIIDGPFKGFVGAVKEINGNKVSLEVKVFGRPTNLNLDAEQIKNF